MGTLYIKGRVDEYIVEQDQVLQVGKYKPKDTTAVTGEADPLQGIWLVLRDPSGYCTSTQTNNNHEFNFVITDPQDGDYILYETVDRKIEGQNHEQEFAKRDFSQPNLNVNRRNITDDQDWAVTSTTARKFFINVSKGKFTYDSELGAMHQEDGNMVVNIGHTVYKKIRCSNCAYFNVVNKRSNEKADFYEIDIKTGNITHKYSIENNNRKRFNGMAYNPKEGLFYITSQGNSETSSDNGGYFFIVREKFEFVDITNLLINEQNPPHNYSFDRLTAADIDDEGIYYGIDTKNSDSGVIIDLNPNSLDFFYVKPMVYESPSESIRYDIADWKYNNNDKNLYSYSHSIHDKKAKVGSNNSYPINSIIKIEIKGEKFIAEYLPTDSSEIIKEINKIVGSREIIKEINNKNEELSDKGRALDIVGIYAYDSGEMFLLSGIGKLYKLNITQRDKNGRIVIKETGKLKGVTGTIDGDGANCSLANLKEDFGNAPNSNILGTAAYKTLLEDNGPRHTISNDIYLGEKVFHEDEVIMGEFVDDNDGVIEADRSIELEYVPGKSYSFNVECYNNTKRTATLYAWLDINCNGKFDYNECEITTVESASTKQTKTITFNIPDSIPSFDDNISATFMRLRLTTEVLDPEVDGDLTNNPSEDPRSISAHHAAIDGEVEDWMFKIIGKMWQEKPIHVVTVDKKIVTKKPSKDEHGNPIEKEVEEDPNKVFSSGDIITYRIVIKNWGPGDVSNVKVSDDLDILDDFEFIEASWEIKPSNGEEKTSGTISTKKDVKDFSLPKLCVGSVFTERIKCRVK